MADKVTTVFDQLTDRPIAYFPCFVRIAGSLPAGVLLAQLLYWDKTMKGKEFYKTDKELISETALTRHEFRAAKAKLNKFKFITTTLKRSPAITHYQVNKEMVIEAVSSLPESGKLDGGNPDNQIAEIRQTRLPESGQHIHTENTSENTSDTPPLRGNNKKTRTKPKSNGGGHHPPEKSSAPDTPEGMLQAERREEAAHFMQYAEKQHMEIRGLPLVIDNSVDPGIVARLVAVKGLSADVLCKCWDTFVRDVSSKFALEKRPKNIFWFNKRINYLLEETRAVEQEAARKITESRPLPKVVVDDNAVVLWSKCLLFLEQNILPENFNTWFVPTVPISIGKNKVVIGVPNRLYAKCLEENYVPDISNALASIGIKPAPELEFIHEWEMADA